MSLHRIIHSWIKVSQSCCFLSGEQDSFREYAYCSFEYLLATAHSTSITTLVTNLESSQGLLLDAEISLVLSSIKLSIEVLTEDPLQLANELIGRLRQLKGKDQLRVCIANDLLHRVTPPTEG